MNKQNQQVSRRHLAHKHIDKRLRTSFYLFLLIAIIMLGIVVFDITTSKIGIAFAIIGIIVGTIAGVISSRMYHISWNKDANKVVSQFDIIGGIILLLYILFEIQRSWIASFFVQGPMIGSVSFALLAGSMIGRVLGTRGKILQVLKQQKIF